MRSHSLNTLARVAGLRGTMLHFTPRSLPAVIRGYAPLNLGGSSAELTVEAWVRVDTTQSPPAGSTYIPVVAWSWKEADLDPYPFALLLNLKSNGDVRPRLSRVTSSSTTEAVEADVALNDGLFHHIAGVRRVLDSTTAVLQLYVDGETDPTWTVISSTTHDAEADDNALLTLGGGLVQIANQGNHYSGLSGDLCQVRVWDGALTGAQIDALRYEALMGPVEVLDAAGGTATATVVFAGNTLAGTVVETAEGVQYATLADGSGGGAVTVAALRPGPEGNAAAGAITRVVSVPTGATTTSITSSTPAFGGADALGGQCATGVVTLTSSGSEAVTVPAGLRVQAGPTGKVFQLTSGGAVNAGSSAQFFVRALAVGADGNLPPNSIDTLSNPNLTPTLTVNNGTSTTHGVDPVPPEQAGSSVGTVDLTNTNPSRGVTLPVGTLVGVATNGAVDRGTLFALTEEATVRAGGIVRDVPVQAVLPGSGRGVAAGAINWVSPLYLGPGDSVSVTNPSAIASVPPRLVRLVGCWSCDEGFGRMVYNYAANAVDPDSQGNGSFSTQLYGAYSLGDLGQIPNDMSEPDWVITTLMAPPPFVT